MRNSQVDYRNIACSSALPKLCAAALCVLFVLQLVWPIPGTIALRNGFLAVLLVLVVIASYRSRASGFVTRLPKWPARLFMLLTVWICLVIGFWGQEPAHNWKEFLPQWLLPMLLVLVGWGLVRWSILCKKQQALIKTLFYAFLSGVFLHDLMGLAYWLATGQQPFRQASVLYFPRLLQGMPWQDAFDGNFGEKFSFVNNMFVAFVLAEIGQRLLTTKRWLQVSNVVLTIALMAAGLCSYWLSFRNGNIGLLSLLGFFGVLLIFARKDRFKAWQKTAALLALGVFLSGLGYAFVKSDPRWQRFSESAQVALEGDPGKAWLTHKDLPILSDGQPVDASAYERISWIKEGIKLSLKYPLGTGFNRSAFFDTLDRDYQLNGQVRGGHSHSGIIDFMVANGIPGAIMWLAFLASCAWIGWAKVDQGNVAQGLTVVFLVTGFFNRGLVDSNIRDHVLQQFLFLLTIYMTITLQPTSRTKHDSINHETSA